MMKCKRAVVHVHDLDEPSGAEERLLHGRLGVDVQRSFEIDQVELIAEGAWPHLAEVDEATDQLVAVIEHDDDHEFAQPMRSWGRAGLRQITLRLRGNPFPQLAALHRGQLRQIRPRWRHAFRSPDSDSVDHADLTVVIVDEPVELGDQRRRVLAVTEPGRCRRVQDQLRWVLGQRGQHDRTGFRQGVGERGRRVAAASGTADDEVGVDQPTCGNAVGGDKHLRVRAPHEDTLAARRVTSHERSKLGRVGSVVEGAGNEEQHPGHQRGNGDAGDGEPAGTPHPLGRHRHSQDHQRWNDLQPVVPEEAQPSRPRGESGGDPQPQVDVGGSRRRLRAGSRSPPAMPAATISTGWKATKPPKRGQSFPGGRPQVRAGENETGAVSDVPLPEPAEGCVQPRRGDGDGGGGHERHHVSPPAAQADADTRRHDAEQPALSAQDGNADGHTCSQGETDGATT